MSRTASSFLCIAAVLLISCGGDEEATAEEGSSGEEAVPSGPPDDPPPRDETEGEDCPAQLDCMPGPGREGPCPPPGFAERCPDTQIAY